LSSEDTLRRRIADAEGALASARADLIQAKAAAREAETAAWRKWSRWIAGLAIPLALAAGALGVYFGAGRVAVPIAGAVVLAAVALLLYAESLPLLDRFGPWFVLGIAVAALLGVAVLIIARRGAALRSTAVLAQRFREGFHDLGALAIAQADQKRAGVHRMMKAARESVERKG
jgi:hypothetical protein